MAEPYLKRLVELIADLELRIQKEVSLECKHFFSGAALYADGKICASLTPQGFGLKLPAETRDRMFEEGEGVPLRYFEGAPIKKEYVLLSMTITDDRMRLRELISCSIGYIAGDGRLA